VHLQMGGRTDPVLIVIVLVFSASRFSAVAPEDPFGRSMWAVGWCHGHSPALHPQPWSEEQAAPWLLLVFLHRLEPQCQESSEERMCPVL